MTIEWDIADGSVDGYEEQMKRYHKPISKHDCDKFYCESRYNKGTDHHDYHELWDDFKLSHYQREKIFMDVVRSRGNSGREMSVLRQFVSTLDGAFIIRLSMTSPFRQQVGQDLRFETREEMGQYYNYCIDLFRFSSALRVGDEEDGKGFFADLDDLNGGFFDDLDDISGDSEDENGWDTDEEDEVSW